MLHSRVNWGDRCHDHGDLLIFGVAEGKVIKVIELLRSRWATGLEALG
jgi:hypothetical protein